MTDRRLGSGGTVRARPIALLLLAALFAAMTSCGGQEDMPTGLPNKSDNPPAASKAAAARSADAGAKDSERGVDLYRYLPDGTDWVFSHDVASLREIAYFGQLVKEFPEAFNDLADALSHGSMSDWGDLRAIVIGSKLAREEFGRVPVTIVETTQDVTLDALLSRQPPGTYQRENEGGQAIAVRADRMLALTLAEPRVVVIGPPDDIQKVLARQGPPILDEALFQALKEHRERTTASLVVGQRGILALRGSFYPFARYYSNAGREQDLLADAVLIHAHAAGSEGLNIEATIAFDNPDSAQQLAESSWQSTLADKFSSDMLREVVMSVTKHARLVADGSRVTATLDLSDREGKRLVRRIVREVQDRRDQENLHELSLALLNHHDARKRLPLPGPPVAGGEPKLSWRVAILPYLGNDERELYDQFHRDEPWDGPHNRTLIDRMPAVFRSLHGKKIAPNCTCYLAPFGDKLSFSDPGKQRGVSLREFIDGTAYTICIVEASPDRAVIWSKPEDLAVSKDDPWAGLVGHREGGFLAAFTDGSVRFIDRSKPDSLLYGLFTRNGQEDVGGFIR